MGGFLVEAKNVTSGFPKKWPLIKYETSDSLESDTQGLIRERLMKTEKNRKNISTQTNHKQVGFFVFDPFDGVYPEQSRRTQGRLVENFL